jgi:uncharacterized membrane protein
MPAYLHIIPAAIYLLGAPFQLSRRFREGQWTLHPRLGRVLLTAGLISGVFAIVFGVLYPFGGLAQASASAVFGSYFVVALTAAFLAIRRGDVTHHRRWMIRAFAVGFAVGTIRIWIGFSEPLVCWSSTPASAWLFGSPSPCTPLSLRLTSARVQPLRSCTSSSLGSVNPNLAHPQAASVGRSRARPDRRAAATQHRPVSPQVDRHRCVSRRPFSVRPSATFATKS